VIGVCVLKRGVKDAIRSNHVRVDRVGRCRIPNQLNRNPPRCLGRRIFVQVGILERLVND